MSTKNEIQSWTEVDFSFVVLLLEHMVIVLANGKGPRRATFISFNDCTTQQVSVKSKLLNANANANA